MCVGGGGDILTNVCALLDMIRLSYTKGYLMWFTAWLCDGTVLAIKMESCQDFHLLLPRVLF